MPAAARTRATSAGVITNEPVLPKLLRTYERDRRNPVVLLRPIGTMTCVYVLPSTGPVSPCRITLIT